MNEDKEYVDALKRAYDTIAPMLKMDDPMNQFQIKSAFKSVFNVLHAQKNTMEKMRNYIGDLEVASRSLYQTVSAHANRANRAKLKETKPAPIIPEGYMEAKEFCNTFKYIGYGQLMIISKNAELRNMRKKIGSNTYVHVESFHKWMLGDICKEDYPKTFRAAVEWEQKNFQGIAHGNQA